MTSDNSEILRQSFVDKKVSLGWAQGHRIYRLRFKKFVLAKFLIQDPLQANALNFYYLRDSSIVMNNLSAFARVGHTVALFDGMKIFEPGCNAGKMLLPFKSLYNADVTGMDIYAPAIEIAKLLIPKETVFTVEDVLNCQSLKALPDNYFDLTIASSFINHVIHMPNFWPFFENLIRISSQIYIHDRVVGDMSALLKSLQKKYMLSELPNQNKFILLATHVNPDTISI